MLFRSLWGAGSTGRGGGGHARASFSRGGGRAASAPAAFTGTIQLGGSPGWLPFTEYELELVLTSLSCHSQASPPSRSNDLEEATINPSSPTRLSTLRYLLRPTSHKVFRATSLKVLNATLLSHSTINLPLPSLSCRWPTQTRCRRGEGWACARSGIRRRRMDSLGIMRPERMLGKVGSLRKRGAFSADPLLRTVFCHNSSLVWSIEDGSKNWASLAAGDQVEFEYGRGERGVEALKVSAVAQFSTRRRGTVAVFHADRGFGFVTDDVPSEVDNKQGAAPTFLSGAGLIWLLLSPAVLVHHNQIKSGSGFKVLTPVRASLLLAASQPDDPAHRARSSSTASSRGRRASPASTLFRQTLPVSRKG